MLKKVNKWIDSVSRTNFVPHSEWTLTPQMGLKGQIWGLLSPLPSLPPWDPAWEPFWGRAVWGRGWPGSPPGRARRGSSPPRPLPTTPSCSLPPPSCSGTHRSQSPLKCFKLLKQEEILADISDYSMTICSFRKSLRAAQFYVATISAMSRECFAAILLRDPYLAAAVWPTAKSWAKSFAVQKVQGHKRDR